MKKLITALLMSLAPFTVFANQPSDSSPQAVALSVSDDQTIAQRHPLLAAASIATLRWVLGGRVARGEIAGDMVALGDFAIALVAPGAFCDPKSSPEKNEFISGALLLALSGTYQADRTNPKQTKLDGIAFSGSLSHISNGIRGMMLPHIETYANNTQAKPYASGAAHAVAGAAYTLPIIFYYAKRGTEFASLPGQIAKETGLKAAYVIIDGAEQFTIDGLKDHFGDEPWVQPVAKAGNSVLLAVFGKTAIDLGHHVLKLAKYVGMPGVAASSLHKIVGNCMFDVVGYRLADAGFSTIQQYLPQQASLIIPALSGGIIGAVTRQDTRAWLAARKNSHPFTYALVTGVFLSATLQVVVSALSMPGWILDTPGNLWNRLTSSTSDHDEL